MRLLKTGSSSLQVKEYFGDNIPKYTILSHTWNVDNDEEVSLEDIRMGPECYETKIGYKKVIGAQREAANNGFQWIWIDTCCIDKSSSSELSEAINSMFRWYQNAEVCYAYLSDISLDGIEWGTPHDQTELQKYPWWQGFAESRWFTRGWTLQELVAPKWVRFYSKEWSEIGTRSQFAHIISYATGISTDALGDFQPAKFSVATKMSWAAKRKTTRAEDMAYCLMGLFAIHMPMLYGEGNQAFIRLQEEIIKFSGDRSLFCWKSPGISSVSLRGLLAESPADFAGSGAISSIVEDSFAPYQMTNKGLMIEVFFLNKTPDDDAAHRRRVLLLAPSGSKPYHGLILTKINHETYARVDSGSQFILQPRERLDGKKISIFVKHTAAIPQPISPDLIAGFCLVDMEVASSTLPLSFSIGKRKYYLAEGAALTDVEFAIAPFHDHEPNSILDIDPRDVLDSLNMGKSLVELSFSNLLYIYTDMGGGAYTPYVQIELYANMLVLVVWCKFNS